MRRGCISLGNVKCDNCQRTIPHSGPYLMLEEKDGSKCFCEKCSLDKGYGQYKVEKGEKVLTFFPEPEG